MSRCFQRAEFRAAEQRDRFFERNVLVGEGEPAERALRAKALAPAQLRAARGAALDDELVDDLLNDLGWQVEFASSPLGQIAKLLLGRPLRPALGGFLSDLVAVVPDRVHAVA